MSSDLACRNVPARRGTSRYGRLPVGLRRGDTVNTDQNVERSLRTPRPDEALAVGEVHMLRGWLEHLRASAIYKVEGLSDTQLLWRPATTSNSAGGIVMHLGYVERFWIRAVFAAEPIDMSWTGGRADPTFAIPNGWTTKDVIVFYQTETAAADLVLDEENDPAARSRAARPTTLRWVLTHLVEETARHVGHLDITRELIDGRTGR